MKGTSIPYRRVATLPPLAPHARHLQARFMNLSLAPRPSGRLIYLQVQLFLLDRNSSSIRLSRIHCPWWNIPPHPPVRQAGLTLGHLARGVTVMNYSLEVMRRVGPVHSTTTVGHKQQVFPDHYSISVLSSWPYVDVAFTYCLGISTALYRFFQGFYPCFIQGAFFRQFVIHCLHTSLIYGVYNF